MFQNGTQSMKPKVSQIYSGCELSDELPTKKCFSIYYFPVKEAMKPTCEYFTFMGWVVLFN